MKRLSRRDERGITHLLLMASAVGVLAVVVIAGYLVFTKGMSKKGTDGSANTSTYSKCLSANNNDSRICNFEKNYTPITSNPYTATIHVTSPQGTVSDLTYGSDGNGNSEVTGSSDGQQLSSIVLSGVTYIKVSGSGWVEYKANDTNTPAQTNPTASMDIAVGQNGLSFQYVSTTQCGSLECYKYTVSDASQSGVTQTIWFDTTSYKLRAWSYQGSTGSTNMSIDYGAVTITAPSPVIAVR